MRKPITTLSLMLLVLLSWGQDSIPILQWDLKDLANLKVTSAGKKEQTLDDAPANVIVITAKDIEERGYLTLLEVFRDLPGFDFATGIPSGEYPTHFLFRGIGDVGQTKFAMLLDGIPQNDISNGWFRHIGFNFPLNNIERIELVSGPGSALFGMNALAGYVNIITKEHFKSSNESFEVAAQTLGGIGNTISQDFNGWHKFNNETSIQLTGRFFQSQGDNGIGRMDPGNYFSNNFEPDSVKLLDGSWISNEKSGGLTKPIPNGFNTSIKDYYLRSKINYKNFDLMISTWEKKEGLGSYVVGYEYFANTDGIDYLAHHKGSSFEMKHSFNPSKNVKSKTRTYINSHSVLPSTGFTYTYQYQSVSNPVDPPVENYRKSYESEGYIFGVEQQLDITTSKSNHLTIGAQFEQKIREFFNINYVNDSMESNLSSINQNIELRPVFFSINGAVFLQDEFVFANDYRLTTGVRFDFDEFYGNVFNPRIALVKSSPKGLNFKVLFGQGYKPPTIFELYDEWRGNHKLVPEVVQTGEIELSYKTPKSTLTTNLFYNNLSNSIQVASNPDTVANPIGESGQKATFYQNIGEMDIIGLSIRGKWAPVKNLVIGGNYQYLEDLNSGALDNVSKHKINFSVNYFTWEKLNINLRGNWISKIQAPSSNKYFHEKTAGSISDVGYDYVTENNPDGFMDGHFLLHLNLVGKNILKFKNFEIIPSLKINNILNTQYAYIGRQSGDGVRPLDAIQPSIVNPKGFIPAYHPQAGIEIYGGLKLKWN